MPDLAVIREGRGVSLEQIARSTRIGMFYLRAIERGQIDKLPGGIYRRSYIAQYARAIDYSAEDLMEKFGVRRNEEPPAAQDGPPPSLLDRLVRFLDSLVHMHITAAGERQR